MVVVSVLCGISVEEKCCNLQLHPLSEVKIAKYIIDSNQSIECYSNSLITFQQN